jgi:plasmid stability protein
MFSPRNLRANVRAIEHSRFTDEEIRWLRAKLVASAAPTAEDAPMSATHGVDAPPARSTV